MPLSSQIAPQSRLCGFYSQGRENNMIPDVIGYIVANRPICLSCDNLIMGNPQAHRPTNAIPVTTSPEFPERFTCKTHKEFFGSVKTFIGTAEASLPEEVKQ